MPTTPTSKPLNIGSPRSGAGLGDERGRTPTPGGGAGIPGTPGRFALLGTPPVPNIPRLGTPRAGPAFPIPSPGLNLDASPGPRLGTPGSYTPSGLSGLAASKPVASLHSGADTPGQIANLDDLTDEEKARVLRRHLMSREEREAAAAAAAAQEAAGASSRRGSDTSLTPGAGPSGRRPSNVKRQETEAFPVPFEAPGADITCVLHSLNHDLGT
jgi:proton-coupled amino acid transporter